MSPVKKRTTLFIRYCVNLFRNCLSETSHKICCWNCKAILDVPHFFQEPSTFMPALLRLGWSLYCSSCRRQKEDLWRKWRLYFLDPGVWELVPQIQKMFSTYIFEAWTGTVMKMRLIAVTVTANALSFAFVRKTEKKKYLLLYALPFCSWLLTFLCTTGNILGSNPKCISCRFITGMSCIKI